MKILAVIPVVAILSSPVYAGNSDKMVQQHMYDTKAKVEANNSNSTKTTSQYSNIKMKKKKNTNPYSDIKMHKKDSIKMGAPKGIQK